MLAQQEIKGGLDQTHGGNCSITDVTARLMRIFPPGVRASTYEQGRIQEAIDATAQPVAKDADYATLIAARVANAEAAAMILDPPKSKARKAKCQGTDNQC